MLVGWDQYAAILSSGGCWATMSAAAAGARSDAAAAPLKAPPCTAFMKRSWGFPAANHAAGDVCAGAPTANHAAGDVCAGGLAGDGLWLAVRGRFRSDIARFFWRTFSPPPAHGHLNQNGYG